MTNLVINTDKRIYLLELRSTEKTYMASVSWKYPQRSTNRARKQNVAAEAAAPIAAGVDLASINFRYAIQDYNPAWRPLRAFDDGEKVCIEFPTGIRQGEMPPLFVIGPAGAPNWSTTGSAAITTSSTGCLALPSCALVTRTVSAESASCAPMEDLGHDGRTERRRKRRA